MKSAIRLSMTGEMATITGYDSLFGDFARSTVHESVRNRADAAPWSCESQSSPRALPQPKEIFGRE
ncbi:hypothetical protein [Glacieibacterium sp.]|uniref:hypothetical protein n=1 Tax=Glacieibacterium sp. TaxID=2860237 RepID=UPI003B0004C1